MRYATLLLLLTIALSYTIDDSNNFLDDTGAIRVFHGFNVVYKPAPYLPITDHFDPMTSFSEEDCQILVDLGFNVIRLHIAFEAGMPERGIVNDQYILQVRDIVRMAAKYDIQVILDAHQDLLNRQFCGEGFPDWAVTKSNFPSPQNINLRYDDNGYPLIEDCLKQDFAKFYLTDDVGRNLESILKNEDGVADMLGVFWKRVAELHRDEPNVLGYEIINEPSSGNYQRSKIDFLWPGWSNKHLIMPFYKIVNQYIREADQEKFVFFEPFFADILGGGFDSNIDEEYKHKEVFSYHVYCGVGIKYIQNQLEKISSWLCKRVQQLAMPLKHKNIKHLGTGSFLTEFGAVPNVPYAEVVLNDLMHRAENQMQSWAYWQYKGYNDFTTASSMAEEGIFNDDSTLQDYKLRALVRPYAYKLCALSVKYAEFDNETIFKLKYTAKEGCQTMIYVPNKYHFEDGFNFDCKNCSLKFIRDNHYEVIGKGKVSLKLWKK